jgi:hypothetical protein
MDSDLQAELATIGGLVEAAPVGDRARQTVLWALNKMPSAYQQLLKTYESRYVDEIVRLVTVIRQELTNEDAPELAASIATRLTAMHSRRGFPSLSLKPAPPTPAKRPKRKAK